MKQWLACHLSGRSGDNEFRLNVLYAGGSDEKL
jgi:hypothetical protein